METWEQAEAKVANFFVDYVRETHPAKDEDGFALYDYVLENLKTPSKPKPHTVHLKEILEKVFSTGDESFEPDVNELKDILLGLIEEG